MEKALDGDIHSLVGIQCAGVNQTHVIIGDSGRSWKEQAGVGIIADGRAAFCAPAAVCNAVSPDVVGNNHVVGKPHRNALDERGDTETERIGRGAKLTGVKLRQNIVDIKRSLEFPSAWG